MPYRVKTGQEVLVVLARSTQVKTLTRDIEFTKKDLLASPLPEHHRESIQSSIHQDFPWGFDVNGRWQDGQNVDAIFAKEVHMVDRATPKDVNTVVVKGSKGTPYTLTINDFHEAMECTCPAFRFQRFPCKHITKWNQSLAG